MKARLKHEELESELVRYKLLYEIPSLFTIRPPLTMNIRYAEAMHQSEDAMSSHRISMGMAKRGSSSTG